MLKLNETPQPLITISTTIGTYNMSVETSAYGSRNDDFSTFRYICSDRNDARNSLDGRYE